MFSLLRSVSEWADWIARALLVPIGVGFVLIVFLGVLTRYVFQAPIITSVELARIGFVWAAFLGAAVCVKGERHTQFLFLLDKAGGSGKRVMKVVIDCISIGFFLFLVIEGVRMTLAVRATYFPALGWSQLWLYAPLPVSAAIMLLHGVAFLARDLLGLDREGEGTVA